MQLRASAQPGCDHSQALVGVQLLLASGWHFRSDQSLQLTTSAAACLQPLQLQACRHDLPTSARACTCEHERAYWWSEYYCCCCYYSSVVACCSVCICRVTDTTPPVSAASTRAQTSVRSCNSRGCNSRSYSGGWKSGAACYSCSCIHTSGSHSNFACCRSCSRSEQAGKACHASNVPAFTRFFRRAL